MVRDLVSHPEFPQPYALLWSVLQDGTREWRGELEMDVPAEAVVWRARPGGPSIGGLMLHIIQVEFGWFSWDVLGEEPSPEIRAELQWGSIDVDAGVWPEVPHQPISWYFARHDRYREISEDLIRRWPDPSMPIPADQEHFDTPAWVLGHVVQHEAYHGGQILMLWDQYKNAHR